jgi:hypothetical protein
MLMIQPQEHESNHRKQDVGIEDHTGIPRRKVVRLDYLHEVRTRRAKQEACGTDDCGSAHIETTAEC